MRRFLSDPLSRAWLALLALSLAGALLTLVPVPQALIGAGVLILALVKARLILSRYLELGQSPAWMRGIGTVLTGFVLLLLALSLL